MTLDMGHPLTTRILTFLAAAAALTAPSFAQDSLAIQRLRNIQARIQQVVERNTSATVLVTDGIGSGSGVIVSPDGLVLTAGHVLTTGGSDYRVTLPTGREVKARPLGKNLNFDAGMVQMVEPGPWPYVELADENSPRVGSWAVCLGHPGGYEIGRTPPVRAGKVLASRQTQLITDCALIGGDSGGPLFDLDGKLIGIHSSISDSIAVNRHVRIGVYREHWERMLRGDSWGTLPDLGDEDSGPSEDDPAGVAIGVSMDLSAARALIERVRPDSPAARAGLRAGDVVTSINGVEITGSPQVIDFISAHAPGDKLAVRLERNGETVEVEVEVEVAVGT
jgi:serine protease Do